MTKGCRGRHTNPEISLEDVEQMHSERAAGLTFKEIGELHGVAASTVRYYIVEGVKDKVIERAMRNEKKRKAVEAVFGG